MLARLAALRAKWRVFMLWTRGRPLGIGQPRAMFLDPFRVVMVPRCARKGWLVWICTRRRPRRLGQPLGVFFDALSVVLVMGGSYERVSRRALRLGPADGVAD